MFREMRRNDKALSHEETLEIVKNGEYAVLATTGSDNYPYAVPLNYAYDNGSIYFHCALSGHKIDNIAHNARVSLCIVDNAEVVPKEFSTKFRSVVVFGKAREVSGEEKEEGLSAIINRFSSDHLEAGKKYIKNAWDKTKLIKIEVEHMTGKASK